MVSRGQETVLLLLQLSVENSKMVLDDNSWILYELRINDFSLNENDYDFNFPGEGVGLPVPIE